MHKRLKPFYAAGIRSLALLALLAAAAPAKADWAAVEAAIKQGRPKTAIEKLEPIVEQALAAKDYPTAVKAIAQRIKLEGDIQGGKAEEKIARLQEELEKAPAEMKPILETVLGHWYWQYFQQNRWRFMQRTQAGGPPGEDILAWDLAQILAEIDRRFGAALSGAAELRKIAIGDWDSLIKKAKAPDSFRPTMYDFLAHQALAFYTTGEQAGAKRQDAFTLPADSPVFDAPDAFLQWRIETTDEDSVTVKALRLMQELMRFHEPDEDPSAFIDVDLQRLQFGYNKAFGETKSERYRAALERFVDEHADHRIAARALAAWATALHSEGDLVEAHRLASRGAKIHPGTPGGNACFNLVQQIEAKSASIATERVWTAPWPTIDVTYRNVDKVYLRAVKFDWEELVKRKGWAWEPMDQNQQQALLKLEPAKTWDAKLPITTDYQERRESLPVPEDLDPGFYFLLASHTPDFREKNNMVSQASFWVSDLALVMRQRHGSGGVEGFVLDARLGRPIEGAKIRSWVRDNHGNKTPGPGAATDANGLFRLPGGKPHDSHVVLASHDGRQVASIGDHRGYRRNPLKPYTRTLFFTDRSIYRPGQQIRYKGLCIRIDQERDNYKTIAGQPVTVLFHDVNGKEIARQAHKANDYGSFTGSFTAPGDRLMGQMWIRTEKEPSGQAYFSVEEYKRPKFQVTLDAPAVAARLDDEVKLTGHAMGYTGAAIDGAQVSYRVVREVRYPAWWYWRCWWHPPAPGGNQEIAHGTAKTEADGSFTVAFTATPDRSVDKASEPIFTYTVYADVTDTSGETRSGQRAVRVGYTALSASMSADEWQVAADPVAIRVHTQTLDYEGQAADVRVKIHRLKEPERLQRGQLLGFRPYWRPHGGLDAAAPKPDPANPNSWELGELVLEQGLTTSAEGAAELAVDLTKVGHYRAVLVTQDRFKNEVAAILPIRVVDPKAATCALKIPNIVAAPSWSHEPGETFNALWGTGYETGRAYIEIEHCGEMLQAFWTDPDRTQEVVEQMVDESMRGGFTLHVTQVRENRAYLTTRHVQVPWSNKQLKITWEHFVSKLEPGAKETWTAVVAGPEAEKAVAEMVATLYDESLDAFRPHAWQQLHGYFRQDGARLQSQFQNNWRRLNRLHGHWPTQSKDASLAYRALPPDLTAQHVLWGWYDKGFRGGGVPQPLMRMAARAPAASMAMADAEGMAESGDAIAAAPQKSANAAGRSAALGGGRGDAAAPAPGPDLGQVAARKNLQETAFFFPQLISGEDGAIRMEFTMPEALTRWKFMGFAHDGKLRSGFLQDSAVTAKDIMVQPNPPRFLREADALEFTVKISNLSATRQEGNVRLTFADARTLKSVDNELKLADTDQRFEVPAKESRAYSWRIQVPDGMGFLQYKAVAATAKLSDGEEGYLPVLPRRIMVTESLPLPIRDAGTKTFTFTKLGQSGKSDSLRHHNLAVQMVSNPSWYAIMALPYIMESPYPCAEQVFNRLYANALARHIAKSDPKIRRVFDLWKGTDALDSPLEKNQDLKSVMLEETPWVRQGESESEARRNVGILFDGNRLDTETAKLMRQLAQMQLADGAWPWFPSGRANDYVTLYITTGYGRLRHLGVKGVDIAPALKSLNRLDAWIDETYREILRRGHKDNNHLSSTIALYLYGRSFFLEDQVVQPAHKEAADYFLGQAAKYWLKLPRQSQAHLALALQRFGQDKVTPQNIMVSIKEYSVSDEEMGMFWRDTELGWWWYGAPIETQAMMVEAFDEVAKDKRAVEDCKIWLLKQKQTRDWKTTKATADAVYALLLRGTDLLASDELVQVSLGGEVVEPKNVEAGTGFYEQRFARGEIKPAMSEIKVAKVDPGVAWGSVHWQYFEDMSKITPHTDTPLTLEKALFVKVNTKKGPELKLVKGALKVGDELVARIVLRVDRDMEYVHMKDQRGAGTEPVNVLSTYKYQDGLGYYESTRDTASHFFIDYLPKGTYVFEYSVRVQHKGEYQGGMALIECMYAPEFNSHSESFALRVE